MQDLRVPPPKRWRGAIGRGAEDAGLRAQAGAYLFADDQPPTKMTNQYRQTER